MASKSKLALNQNAGVNPPIKKSKELAKQLLMAKMKGKGDPFIKEEFPTL